MVIMAPSDELELKHAVATSHAIDDAPSAFRYPRGNGLGLDLTQPAEILQIGKGRIIREGSKVAILSLGCRLEDSLKAAVHLKELGITATVADARFAKPVDEELVCQLAKNHEVLLTIEAGSIGGFAAQVTDILAKNWLFDKGLKFRPMYMPDQLLDHDAPASQYKDAGLSSDAIISTVLIALGREKLMLAS